MYYRFYDDIVIMENKINSQYEKKKKRKMNQECCNYTV